MAASKVSKRPVARKAASSKSGSPKQASPKKASPKAVPRKAAPTKAASPKAPAKAARTKERMTLAEVMRELETAGSAQTRKTYARHGAREPMFGVSFATLKALTKRIGVDHELAVACGTPATSMRGTWP